MPGMATLRIRVGDAGEDRVIGQQPLESAEIDLRRDGQQHGGECDRHAAQRDRRGPMAARVSTRAPPLTTAKKIDAIQMTMAIVVSQPTMSCQAGSVNR